jgi:hypothetical protein
VWMESREQILAALSLAGHLFLVGVLLRQSLAGRVPFFTGLMLVYALRPLMFLLQWRWGAPEWVYWSLIAGDPALQMLLIFAMLSSLYRAGASRPSARIGYRLLLIFCGLSIAALAAWITGPSSHFSGQNLTIKAGVLVSVLWLQLAALTAIQPRLPQMHRLGTRIVYGFALYSAVSLSAEIVRMFAIRRPGTFLALSLTHVIIYLACLGLWIVTSLRGQAMASSETLTAPV